MKENPSGDQSPLGRKDESICPRVVILPGTYHGWNMGDIAMLVMAIRRLRSFWPKSEITVLAYELEPFRKLCPNVGLFPLQHRDAWLESGARPSAVAATSGGTNDHENKQRLCLPHATATEDGRTPINSESLHTSPPGSGPRTDGECFLDLMTTADLFLMTGCGAINDVWNANAVRILETFDLAIRLGVPTAMVGQGIGPIHDPALLTVAMRVLPRVWFLGLRDKISSELLVSRLGVDALRLQVTGDDAVELAYQERPEELGRNIGINLRLADYSGITENIVAGCAEILKRKARDCRVRLLGVPISLFRGESDSDSLRKAFGDPNPDFDDGAGLDSPLKIIRQTRECRVVVTASYHAAVFALAMGIPAVGIAQSDYYRQKFDGLAGLFGEGCAVVDAGLPGAAGEIERQFDRLWAQAPVLRNLLTAAAADQVGKGRAAYESLLYMTAAGRITRQRRDEAAGTMLPADVWPAEIVPAGLSGPG